MLPFQTILVAADFSESSRDAFRVACSLARADKTRLIVLHVVEPLYVAPDPVYLGDQTVPFTLIERDQSYYDSAKERMRRFYAPGRPIEVEYRTRDGEPAEKILELAREVGSDIVVMGTHGRTGLDRFLTGSVAEQVIRKAICPVLALRSYVRTPRSEPEDGMIEAPVDADRFLAAPASASALEPELEPAPADDEEEGEESPEGVPIQFILHPTDFSVTADAALRVARSLAREQRARLLILHVIPSESVPIEVPPLPIDRGALRAALEDRRARAVGEDRDFTVETMLREGDPEEQILRVAEESGSELIVMGTHGRRGLGRLLMGSVAEAILRRSGCPVLTVKTAQPETLPTPGEPASKGVMA